MMGLIYLWVRVQAGIDHDPVDKVVNHGGDAVDTAEPLIKAGRILSRRWLPLLLFLKAGGLKHYSIGWMIAAPACAPMTSAALLGFSSQRIVRLKMFSEFRKAP